MRCPDCNKFVSMENGDVEVDSVELDESSLRENGEVVVSIQLSMVRNCADCSTELKRWSGETEEGQYSIDEKHRGEGHELEVNENGDTSIDETGGGRYAKNIITASVGFTIDCSCGENLVTDSLKAQAAAGEFDESV